MEKAIRRIVYCKPEYLSAMPADKAEVMDEKLPVRAVSDDVLLQMRGGFSLLYFSSEDYDHAVRKLTTEQVREVVATRREMWSPEAAGHSIAWLNGEMRKCLSLTALALKQSHRPGTTTLLQQIFEHTIKRLAALRGSPSLGILMPSEVFEIALQGEARLSMEYTDLQVPNGPQLAKNRLRRVRTFAEIMSRLGDDAFLEGLPFVVRKRGVNVFPLHLMIREAPELVEEGALLTDWGGGTVIPWPHHELDNLVGPGLEQEDVARHLLYLDAEQYEIFAATATRVQKERDFGERLKMAMNTDSLGIGDFIPDHINGLITDQLVYLWSLRGLFKDLGREDVAPELDSLIQEDVPFLLESLQKSCSWLPEIADGEKDVLKLLISAEEKVLKSAELFSQLEYKPDWIGLRPDFDMFLGIGSKLQELKDAYLRRS